MPGPLPKYPIQLTPEQERALQPLSTCYRAPFAEVQRARMLLLAHQHPTWQNVEIARQVGCGVQTVKHWRQRWQQTDSHRVLRIQKLLPFQYGDRGKVAFNVPKYLLAK